MAHVCKDRDLIPYLLILFLMFVYLFIVSVIDISLLILYLLIKLPTSGTTFIIYNNKDTSL